MCVHVCPKRMDGERGGGGGGGGLTETQSSARRDHGAWSLPCFSGLRQMQQQQARHSRHLCSLHMFKHDHHQLQCIIPLMHFSRTEAHWPETMRTRMFLEVICRKEGSKIDIPALDACLHIKSVTMGPQMPLLTPSVHKENANTGRNLRPVRLFVPLKYCLQRFYC